MFTINLITFACLAILVLELFSALIGLITKNKAEKIAFLKGFKNGRCTVIYVTAIPLYWIGLLYEATGGELSTAGVLDYVGTFFSSIKYIIDLVVLKYETAHVDALMKVSEFYSFTIYFCFALVGLNALLFAFSLVSQRVWEYGQKVKSLISIKKRLFIFGDNEGNRMIYDSGKKYNRVIIDKLSPAATSELYIKEISYINAITYESAVSRLVLSLKLFGYCTAVVNTGDEDANMLICRAVIEELEKIPENKRQKLFPRLNLFVFGDPDYESIYEDIVRDGFGCIHYVNKYQKVAIDFIDKYPIAAFMDERHLDYSTATVKPETDVNMLLVGFGKTNRQIFLTSVANNQFLEAENPADKANDAGYVKTRLKQVNYHIFDKDTADSGKFLNWTYYRFKNEFRGKSEADYLPLPELPANEIYHSIDIYSLDFYDALRETVTKNKKDVNLVVIAYGSDLENLEVARRLVEKRREWGNPDFKIFVRCRTYHKAQESLADEGVFFIGNEKDIIFDISSIVSDKIIEMAKMRNETYDLEYDITHTEGLVVDDEYVKANAKRALKKWHSKKTQLERESSLYCCLSLRSKLNLIGFDVKPAEAPEPEVSEAEYLKVYAKGDMPTYEAVAKGSRGKKIVKYSLDFKKSLRTNLAIHEHARWNSFMLSKGVIPSDIDEIKSEQVYNKEKGKYEFTNGRNYSVRRHGNITTFDGLVTFRKLVLEREGGSESQWDVIKYDYQILDDAHWFLKQNGYKIVRKTPLS